MAPKPIPPTAALNDDWWRAQGCWAILAANANSWKSAAASILPFATDDILMLQESKKNKERRRRRAAINDSRASGWSTRVKVRVCVVGSQDGGSRARGWGTRVKVWEEGLRRRREGAEVKSRTVTTRVRKHEQANK